MCVFSSKHISVFDLIMQLWGEKQKQSKTKKHGCDSITLKYHYGIWKHHRNQLQTWETEAQGRQVLCLRSHRKWVSKLRLKLGFLLWSRSLFIILLLWTIMGKFFHPSNHLFSLLKNPIKNQNNAGSPNSLPKAVCCLLAILCGLLVQLSCSAFHRRACKLPLILNKSIQIFRIYEYEESCFLSHCISSLAFFPLPAFIKIFFFFLMTWDKKSAEIFNIFFPIFCMIIVVMINAATIYILQGFGVY